MSTEIEFRHLLGKARDAKRGGEDAWHVQSTGEKLAAALVLDRPDWIKAMGYTLAEAVDRVGPEWCALVLQAQRALAAEDDSRDDWTTVPKQ